MALIEDQDYVIVRRAALFDGSRFNQQAGNMIATKNRVIFNVIDHADGMAKMSGLGEGSIKDSWQESKDEFAKLKLFGKYADEVRKIGSECSSLQDFETKVEAMFIENPISFSILNSDIAKVKTGIFAGLQITMSSGKVYKFGPQGKGKVKRMIGK
ncbi:MAG: hypothetical protein V2A54_11460 [Bacteroidota bacterium]